jgi:hypothetical protein
VGIPDEATLIR